MKPPSLPLIKAERARGWTRSYWRMNKGSETDANASKRRKGRWARSSWLHQFFELKKEKEMQGKFTWMHHDLTWRQDNVNQIVWEQKAAYFPAGRRRTTMIENNSHSFVVWIMMGHSLVKSHRIKKKISSFELCCLFMTSTPSFIHVGPKLTKSVFWNR